ncbi:MAG: cupin domain-containing protein [Kofleriaceae bacterium]|nr:cupin domain-containing protein [Kofleriaceae bacterium]
MLDRILLASIGTLALASTAFAQPAKQPTATTSKQAPPAATPAAGEHEHLFTVPKDIKWTEGPPMLPKGSKIAVIEGDMKSGPFTFRIQLPANYKISPHTHPGIEHVTVLGGEVMMGAGDKVDEKAATKLPVGSFVTIPAGHVHYLVTKKKAEVQVHGTGPWDITYVNSADDPRNAAVGGTTPPAPAKGAAAMPAMPKK